MGLNYTKLASTAKRLIEDNGKALAVSRTSGGTFNPSTNSLSGESAATYSVSGVFLSINEKMVDGINIKREDKTILLYAKDLGIAIQEKDVIIDGSDNWNVINVESINPAGTDIYYNVRVRK